MREGSTDEKVIRTVAVRVSTEGHAPPRLVSGLGARDLGAGGPESKVASDRAFDEVDRARRRPRIVVVVGTNQKVRDAVSVCIAASRHREPSEVARLLSKQLRGGA